MKFSWKTLVLIGGILLISQAPARADIVYISYRWSRGSPYDFLIQLTSAFKLGAEVCIQTTEVVSSVDSTVTRFGGLVPREFCDRYKAPRRPADIAIDLSRFHPENYYHGRPPTSI